MSRLFMSSGDMVADRRFDFARDLQLRGDLAAAADLFEQAIELAPDFATAWFALGDIREQLGDRDGAIAAFTSAQLTDALDRNGAGLRLTRLSAAAAKGMSPHYVTALFDQYAGSFETSLVDTLGYCGPAALLEAVTKALNDAGRPMRFQRAIDLGCGTGLAARAFASVVEGFVGIDLSSRMIAKARDTGLYQQLEVADAVMGLVRRPDASADLILAADVVIYLHDLAPLLAEAARVLTPGGVLAFTAETHGGDGVMLGAKLRYAHGATYLRDAIAAGELILSRFDNASIRNEAGVPAPGVVVVATRH